MAFELPADGADAVVVLVLTVRVHELRVHLQDLRDLHPKGVQVPKYIQQTKSKDVGTAVRPKYIPYTCMEPLGSRVQKERRQRRLCVGGGGQGDLVSSSRQTPKYRAPKNHLNIRILPTMVSACLWYPPYTGPWNQNVRSLCLRGLLAPKVVSESALNPWLATILRGSCLLLLSCMKIYLLRA